LPQLFRRVYLVLDGNLHLVESVGRIGEHGDAHQEHAEEVDDVFQGFSDHSHVKRKLWEQAHPVVQRQPGQHNYDTANLDKRVQVDGRSPVPDHASETKHVRAPEDEVPRVREVGESALDKLSYFHAAEEQGTETNEHSDCCLSPSALHTEEAALHGDRGQEVTEVYKVQNHGEDIRDEHFDKELVCVVLLL
jgi:hypothetical protein